MLPSSFGGHRVCYYKSFNTRNYIMKAPEKVYLHGYVFDDEPCKTWEREPKVKGMRGYKAEHVAYIRKDYLLEWAEKMLEEAEITNFDERGKGEVFAWNTIIEKLKSL